MSPHIRKGRGTGAIVKACNFLWWVGLVSSKQQSARLVQVSSLFMAGGGGGGGGGGKMQMLGENHICEQPGIFLSCE